jgi:GAF domain-containing protein
VNWNPSVEPGYLSDTTKFSTLRSALAVPMEGASAIAAVLALYRAGQDAFSADDLRIVQAIAQNVGRAIEASIAVRTNSTAVGAS